MVCSALLVRYHAISMTLPYYYYCYREIPKLAEWQGGGGGEGFIIQFKIDGGHCKTKSTILCFYFCLFYPLDKKNVFRIVSCLTNEIEFFFFLCVQIVGRAIRYVVRLPWWSPQSSPGPGDSTKVSHAFPLLLPPDMSGTIGWCGLDSAGGCVLGFGVLFHRHIRQCVRSWGSADGSIWSGMKEGR